MKKITVFCMAIGIALTFASCGNKSVKSDSQNESKDSTVAVNILNDGANAKAGRVENMHYGAVHGDFSRVSRS